MLTVCVQKYMVLSARLAEPMASRRRRQAFPMSLSMLVGRSYGPEDR